MQRMFARIAEYKAFSSISLPEGCEGCHRFRSLSSSPLSRRAYGLLQHRKPCDCKRQCGREHVSCSTSQRPKPYDCKSVCVCVPERVSC